MVLQFLIIELLLILIFSQAMDLLFYLLLVQEKCFLRPNGYADPTGEVRLQSTGDISFKDSSNNQAFYWDASTARLGIGTTSPNNNLHIYDATVNVVATFESGDANVYISFKDSNTAGYDDVFIGAVNQDL